MPGAFSVRADLYDLVYASKDYAAEAQRIQRIVEARWQGARTLLDVACGTGRHLQYLSRRFEVEGLDLDSAMLEHTRRRLPSVPLHRADMVAFDLGRRFDVVTCLFSSIAQVRTVPRLEQAVAAMTRHLESRGILLIEPWISPDDHPPVSVPWIEVFEEKGRKAVVMETSRLDGDIWVEDEHVLLWTPAGIEHTHERTETGAFTSDDYLRAFEFSGLEAEYDAVGLIGRGLFIGARPA